MLGLCLPAASPSATRDIPRLAREDSLLVQGEPQLSQLHTHLRGGCWPAGSS